MSGLIVMPPFFAGLVYGLDKRLADKTAEDKYAHFKVVGIASVFLFLRSIPENMGRPLAMTPRTLPLFLVSAISVPTASFFMGQTIPWIPKKIDMNFDCS